MDTITGGAFAGTALSAGAGAASGAARLGRAQAQAWGGAGRRLGGGLAYRRLPKRMLDIALVLMVSLPVLVLVLGLMALVALDGHSPLFIQERLGRGGRTFRMVKLRTMVPDAERALQAALDADPAVRAEWDHHQKLRRDPRITRAGALLRRTSLDELPQLWNVLKGDMSLVGPRPMLPSQAGMYPGSAYYALRPGLTGFWQVSVRNESSFAERAAFDGRYHAELSLATDLRVMWRTLGVVAAATGV